MVQHQGQSADGFRFQTDERLRRGVDLDALESAPDPILDDRGVRGEGDASVDQDAEVGPTLAQIPPSAAPIRPPLPSHALAADDLRDLYVVTGSRGGPSDNCGTVYRTRVDVPGVPVPPCRVSLRGAG